MHGSPGAGFRVFEKFCLSYVGYDVSHQIKLTMLWKGASGVGRPAGAQAMNPVYLDHTLPRDQALARINKLMHFLKAAAEALRA